MAGLLKGIFGGKLLERAKILGEYEQCRQERAAIIRSYRINALTELQTVYPDVDVAMPAHSLEFFAVSHHSNAIVFGEFGDRFAPELDWVETGSGCSLEKVSAAINSYKKSKSLYEIRRRSAQSPIKSLSETPYIQKLKANGYVLNRFRLDWVQGIKLSKNDRTFAIASKADTASLASMSEKLFDAVVNNLGGTENGLSRISIRIEVKFSLIEGRPCTVNALYEDRRRTRDQNREYLVEFCKTLVPFLLGLSTAILATDYDEDTFYEAEQFLEDR